MKRLLIHWLTGALALGATAWVVPGVRIESLSALLVSALVMGFLNAILKPVLVVLTLPITCLTLGFFYLVLNAMIFALTANLVPGFDVDRAWSALLGAVIMSLVSMFIGSMFNEKRRPTRG